MVEEVGRSVHVISVDKSVFDKGLRQAESQAKRTKETIDKRFGRIGKRMEGVGRTVTLGLTLPIVAAGFGILRAAGNFEAGMTRVEALTEATTEEMAKLTEQAKELGATTKFSATQAAGGMEFLAKAGFEVLEIADAIGPSLELAAAGNVDLATSADIASNILQAFGLEASEMGRIADVMAQTFSNSNTDLRQLAEAMKFAGPTAAAFGQSVEETSASIGLLGNAGIQASLAGTAMRNAMVIATGATGKIKTQMDALGLSLTTTEGNFVGITETIRQLEESGASAAEVMQIFGRRAGPAMLTLLEQGSGALVEFTNELENAGGTAERIAEKQMDNFNGAMIQLKSALEGLAIAIADSGLLEFATKIARKLTDLTRKLRETNPQILKFGTIIAGVAAVMGPLLIVGGKVSQMFGGYLQLLPKLGKALMFLMANPIIAIVGIIAVLVLSNEELRETLFEMLGLILTLVSTALQPLFTVLKIVMSVLKPLVDILAKVLVVILLPIILQMKLWAAAMQFVQNVIRLLVEKAINLLLNSPLGKVIQAWKRGFDRLADPIKKVLKLFSQGKKKVEGITDAFETVSRVVTQLKDDAQLMGEEFDDTATIARVLGNAIRESLTGNFEELNDITGDDLIQTLKDANITLEEFIDSMRTHGQSLETVARATELITKKTGKSADQFNIIKIKVSEVGREALPLMVIALQETGQAFEIIDDVVTQTVDSMGNLTDVILKDVLGALKDISDDKLAFRVFLGEITLDRAQEIKRASNVVVSAIEGIERIIENTGVASEDLFSALAIERMKEVGLTAKSTAFSTGGLVEAFRRLVVEEEKAAIQGLAVIDALDGITTKQLALRVLQGDLTIFEAGALLKDAQLLNAELDQIERTIGQIAGPGPIVSALLSEKQLEDIDPRALDFTEFLPDLANVPTIADINEKFGKPEDLLILGIADDLEEIFQTTFPDAMKTTITTAEDLGDVYNELADDVVDLKEDQEDIEDEMVGNTLTKAFKSVGDFADRFYSTALDTAGTATDSLKGKVVSAELALLSFMNTLGRVQSKAGVGIGPIMVPGLGGGALGLSGSLGVPRATSMVTAGVGVEKQFNISGPVSITGAGDLESAFEEFDRLARGSF